MTTQSIPINQPDRTWLGVLLIATALLLACGAFIWLRLTGPSDGARLADGRTDRITLTPLEDQPGPLRDGDVVIAVAGRSMESWAQAFLTPTDPPPHWQAGQTTVYTIMRDERSEDVALTLQPYPTAHFLAEDREGTLIFELALQAVATFVFFKRPRDRAAQALFLAASGLLASLPWSLGLQISDLIGRTGFWLYQVTTFYGYMLTWSGGLHLMLVFPRPRAIIRRNRWIVPLVYAVPYAIHMVHLLATRLGASSTLEWLRQWNGDTRLLEPLYLILFLIALITAYRAARSPVSRQQMRWVVFAGAVTAGVYLVLGILPSFVLGHMLVGWNVLSLVDLMIPLALAIAILRYRLWDIDIVINRTLVYISLTASVVAIYILIVGSLGTMLQTGRGLPVSLFATGIVAMSFQPIRERLQRGVNRLMYGERDDPYAVLGRLSERLEVVVASQSVLPTIVEIVADAFKLPYAAIALKEGELFTIAAEHARARRLTMWNCPKAREQFTIAAEYTRSSASARQTEMEILPLIYQAETIGQLILARRAPGEPFSQTDRRLLETIARQAGIAAYNVRLTGDLQRSRERLVTTREEERRRLRRDLHDGLGPGLASMSFKLDAIHNLADRDAPTVKKMVMELKTQMQDALADIRRIAYDLRPPALDELGLVGALQAHIASYNQAHGLQITLEAPESPPPLPAAVEVAAYRIALEAITNASRHSGARHCWVRLSLYADLCLEVCDNGRGMAGDFRAGVGMASMRERAEELGGTYVVATIPAGGTCATAHLPLPVDERVN